MEVSLSELYSKLTYQLEERDVSSDNSGDNSPSSTTFSASISASPKRRRAIQKKVVNVSIKEVEGSKFKGDCTPPSDSWAWRKYGQKPIKGSPYPRGYYRCSSSKGCPARKQVERSRSDPDTLVITYSYEHNHTWPISRNNNRHNNAASTTPTPSTLTCTTTDNVSSAENTNTSSLTSPLATHNQIKVSKINKSQPKMESNNVDQPTLFQQNMDQHEPLMAPTDELTWLTSDHHILENNSFFNNFSDLEMSKFFQTREEDESLFADLGELPECSVEFRRAAGVSAGEECSLTPATTWCGTSI